MRLDLIYMLYVFTVITEVTQYTHTFWYRAMEFIHTFIGEVANGEQSLDVAAGKSFLRPLWGESGVFFM